MLGEYKRGVAIFNEAIAVVQESGDRCCPDSHEVIVKSGLAELYFTSGKLDLIPPLLTTCAELVRYSLGTAAKKQDCQGFDCIFESVVMLDIGVRSQNKQVLQLASAAQCAGEANQIRLEEQPHTENYHGLIKEIHQDFSGAVARIFSQLVLHKLVAVKAVEAYDDAESMRDQRLARATLDFKIAEDLRLEEEAAEAEREAQEEARQLIVHSNFC